MPTKEDKAAIEGAEKAAAVEGAENAADIRAAERAAMRETRRKSEDNAERSELARVLFDEDADDLARIAADLKEHGISLADVLRKAAHNQFGVVI